MARALDDTATGKRILDLGDVIADMAGPTTVALGALVKGEVARWTPILKAAGAVAN